MYPVLRLMKEPHAEGRLTPAQATLMAQRRPTEELYDLESDPWEIHNLTDSEDPAHRRARADLSAVLERWLEEVSDHGRTLEPPEIIEQVRRESDAF